MRRAAICFSICALFFGFVASASSSTFLDYQNYNRGYCPDCQCAPCSCQATGGQCPHCSATQVKGKCPNCSCKEQEGTCPHCTAAKNSCSTCSAAAEGDDAAPCDPCAPVCGAEQGSCLAAFGLGATAIGIAAFLILTAGSGNHTSHR